MLCLSNHAPICALADLEVILENGLWANVWTARSAAKLLLKVAEAQQSDLLPLIDDAFHHWQEHEEPYPKRGGAIPESPRADLAKARLAIEGPDYDRAKVHLSDQRSDVSDVGKSALVQLIEAEDDAFVSFIADIEDNKLDAAILSFVLGKLESLSARKVGWVVSLLDHGREEVRFAAMAILDRKYLDADEIRKHLTAMRADSSEDIRDRALSRQIG